MRVVRAQSRGTCPECLESINLGDEILPADKPQTPGRAWQHASCATGLDISSPWEDRPARSEEPSFRQTKRKTPMCPECNMEHRGECF